MDQPAAPRNSLFSVEFVSLNVAVFFGFCNLAMFYGFYSYLTKLGVAAEWRGFLVGLEPFAAFAGRFLLIPLLHRGNAFRAMLASLGLIAAALCGYMFALTVPSLIAVRIVHGAGFVLLVSSATVLLVSLIPKERSAQAFAVMSIAWLVPYAVMPVVFDLAARVFSNEAHIYALSTTLIAPGLVLLAVTKRRIEDGAAKSDAPLKPPLRESLHALKSPGIRALLGLSFTLFFANTSVFFFMQSFMQASGFGDSGPFFAISTVMVILSRVAGGKLLDAVSKWRALLVFVPLLAASLILFSRTDSRAGLYALAALFGVALGVVFPVVNAAMFLSSPPHLRAVNANLVQLVMDAGYFLSPPVAGALIARGFRLGALFDLCAALAAFGLLSLVVFRWVTAHRPDTLVFDPPKEATA